MGKFSNYAENELLDHVLKVGSYSRPANLYLAFCTEDPGDAGTGSSISEPSGGGYARTVCDDWSSGVSRATSNSVAITIAEATGYWGIITHWAICDASSAGNMIAYGDFTPTLNITPGQNVSVSIGDIAVSFKAGGISTYLANALLDHVFEDTAYSQPTNIFVALTINEILDTNNGTNLDEPSSGYFRELCNAWDAAASGLSDNTAAIEFVEAGARFHMIHYFALTDDSEAGNMLFHSALDTSMIIEARDKANFAAGELNITMD